jgi:hypothetical protein
MNLRNLALFCLLILFSFIGFSANALAADSGLADGLYYDVSHPGSGVDVRATPDDGVFLAVYVSRTSTYGWPTWFTAEGGAADTTFDLLATNARLIDPGPQVLTPTGAMAITVNDDGSFDAVIVIRDELGPSPPTPTTTVRLHLVRLI